jgi:mediator of RNA polymerase II transcription subunit 12
LAEETKAPLRKQPGYNPMSYSFDTAKEVMMWFKKQLGEINLPTARLQSTALKQVFKGVMLDVDTRIAWCTKFVYT